MKVSVLVTLVFCSGYSLASENKSSNAQEHSNEFLPDNILLASFESLNNDGQSLNAQTQGNEDHNNPEVLRFVDAYAGEFPNENGKIDLGIEEPEEYSSLLESVSKDRNVLGGIPNSPLHGPEFFETINKRPDGSSPVTSETSTLDTSTSSEVRPVKPGNVIKISHGGTLRQLTTHETTASLFWTPGDMVNTITSATPTQIVRTPSIKAVPKSAEQLQEQHRSKELAPPSESSTPLTETTKTHVLETPLATAVQSAVPTPEATNNDMNSIPIPLPNLIELSSNPNEPQSLEVAGDNIENFGIDDKVKNMIDNYLKDKLGSKPFFSKEKEDQNEMLSTETIPQAPNPSPVSTPQQPETKVTTSTNEIEAPSATQALTPSPLPKEPETPQNVEGVQLQPENQSDELNIERLIKEYFPNGKLDLNSEKLKSLLGNILKLDGSSEQKDTASLESPDLPQVDDQALNDIEEEEEQEDPLGSLIGFSQLERGVEVEENGEDDEPLSIEDEVLQKLGLADLLEESRNLNIEKKGSILETLRKIPGNVFDLVDKRYGEEYGLRDGEAVEQTQDSEKKGKKKMPKAEKQEYELKEEELKSKSKSKLQADANSKATDKALDTAIKDHTSLNKIAKPKNGKSRASITSDTSLKPQKEEEEEEEKDDDYQQLDKGKLVFGFGKKKKKTSKQLQRAKTQAPGEDNSDNSKDEVEYYNPEDYLFSKASTDDQDKDEDEFSSKDLISHKTHTTKTSEEDGGNKNSTASPLTQVLDLLNESDDRSKKSSHNDPYAIPKVPIGHLKEMEDEEGHQSGKGQKTGQKLTATKSISANGDKTSKNSLDKFKKNPSLLFSNRHTYGADDDDESFDFTRSEAMSNKVFSWSIMGAAVLLAMSMALI